MRALSAEAMLLVVSGWQREADEKLRLPDDPAYALSVSAGAPPRPNKGLTTMAKVLPDLEAANAEIAALKAQLAAKAAGPAVTLKISPKTGVLSAYGLGRFPVSLYAGQWLKLLAQAETIKTYISAHNMPLEKASHAD
jgi:hypothetical protein